MKVEIIHDSLAKKIYNLIDAEDRMWLKIEQFIQNRYQYFLESGDYLNAQNLEYIAPYLDDIQISEEQRTFIEVSKKKVQSKFRRKRLIIAGSIGFILFAGLMLLRYFEKENLLLEAQQHACSANLSAHAIQISSQDQTLAFKLANLAVEQDPDNKSALAIENSMLFQSAQFPFYHKVINNHDAPIVDLAISNDNQTLLAADTLGMVGLVDTSGKIIIPPYQAHNAMIYDVDFVGYKGKTHIFTGSADGTACLWNTKGERIQTFYHRSKVNDVTLTADGDFIMTVGHDGYAKRWNHDGSIKDSIYLHEDQISSIDLMKDKKHLITSDIQGRIRITNLDTKRRVLDITNESNAITNMDYSGSNNLLAVGFKDGTLKLLKLNKNSQGRYRAEVKIFFKAHEKAIQDLVLDGVDEQVLILTSSEDNTAKLWDEKGNNLKTLLGHKNGLRAIDISINEKTREWLVMSGGEDRTLKLWYVHPYEEQTYTHSADPNALIFDNIGNSLSLATPYMARLRDNALKPVANFPQKDPIIAFTISPDGSEILTASQREITRWDAQGISLNKLSISVKELPQGQIKSLAFSPTGNQLLVGFGQTILVYDQKGEQTLQIDAHSKAITQVIFSPDSENILSASEDYTIKLWDTKGKLLTTFADHQKAVQSIAFSPDGKQFLSGCSDSQVKLWQVNKTTPIHHLNAHTERISKVAFSPDGKTILSASHDKTVMLWDEDGNQKMSFISHSQPILDAAFSPDGQKILSIGSDDKARSWLLSNVDDLLNKLPALTQEEKELFLAASCTND